MLTNQYTPGATLEDSRRNVYTMETAREGSFQSPL
jgi:hypothetical protein